MHAAIHKTSVHLHESSLSMRFVARQVAMVASALALSSAAMAFQIAPMGSAFESKLTNETENSLATVAGRLGVLIKGRVHEEITQIGMGSRLLLLEQCQRLALAQFEHFSNALQLCGPGMNMARLPLVDRYRRSTQQLSHLLLRNTECCAFVD